ncbi:MAG: NAD(P)H-dependent oxidoreductase [Hyphomicrobiaceae bacterium]
MRTLVLFYSLTGTTRTAATALARELGADIEEIRCDRYQTGFWGFWRAAADSWRKRRPAIHALAHDPARYDAVVLAGPIWAFSPAPPLLAVIDRERLRLPKVAWLLTHGGSAGERSLALLNEVFGRKAVAAVVIKEKDVKAGPPGPSLAPISDVLRGREAA